MAMDIVKRTIEILAKGAVQSVAEPFTNVTRLKEDASKIRDEVAKGYSNVRDTYKTMRSGSGLLKSVTDWFYQRGDQYGSDFEDDDFDSGFDSGMGADEESHGKLLDADAMKDIAKSQVGAMYRIGGKQVEASMMNTAEIITNVNARTTEITAAVNNLNKSIVDIGKKLDTISQVIAYKQKREEQEYAQSIVDSSGRLSVANIFSQAGKNVKGSLPIQMGSMMFQIAQQGGPVELASMLMSMFVGDKKIGALGNKSINQVAGDINEGIGTVADKILSKIISNSKFKEIFGDVTKNRDIGGDYRRTQNEYTRDRAIFDGVTRKTIIDVIPGYLREITKALAGVDLAPDRQGNLSKKHTDYFREDALKGFGFSASSAYKDSTKKDIDEQVKARYGKDKFTTGDIRNAENVLVDAAVAIFFMNHYQHITPALVVQNQDEIFDLAFDMLSHAFNTGGWAQSKPKEDWYKIFTIIMTNVMADATSMIGASSNKFVTQIQQKINSIHNQATAASQDYVAGKKARKLTRGDFVVSSATHLQEYGNFNAELTDDAQDEYKKDLEELRKLESKAGGKLMQKRIDDLRKKTTEMTAYARKEAGELHGKYASKNDSVLKRMKEGPGIVHIEDIGKNILWKLHDVIQVKIVKKKPKEFYPEWMKPQASGGSSEPDVDPTVKDATESNNQTIEDIVNGVTENISQMFPADSIPGKVGQYFQNRAELKGTTGRGRRVMDAISNGASAVGQAIRTRGGSIRDAIGNFIGDAIDDVKNMGADFIDRRLEEQENRKNSISRATQIRSDIGNNNTITDADKTAADTALAMMQSALQDGDGSKEKSAILRQVEKIKNRDLKESIRESVISMMNVQSTKESTPAKTKLGKILKWAFTGLGVVFAPIIKAVKSIGSIFMKGVKMIGGFFKNMAAQLVGYGKKFGSATLELGKRGASAAWSGIKSLGSKVSNAGSSLRNKFRRNKGDGEASDDTDYTQDFGDESGPTKPGIFSRAMSKTKGVFSGASDKIKNSKFMQSDFMKGFSEGFAKPDTEKEKTPEAKMEDILKSEEPKGVFKTFIAALHDIRDAWKKKDNPTDTNGKLTTGDKTKTATNASYSAGDLSFNGTAEGEVDSGNVIGDLSSLGNSAGGAVDGATDVAKAAGNAGGVVAKAASAGGKVGSIMGLIGKAVGALGGILKVATISALAVKVLLKIGMEVINIGIKPLKKAISNFWKALKPVIKALGNALAEIIEPLAEVLNVVIKLVAPILTYLGKAVGKIVSWAMTFLSPVIEMIGNTVKVVGGVVEVGFGYTLKGFAMVGKLLKTIAKIVTFGFGGDGIGAIVDAIDGFADTLITMGKQNFSEGISGIVQAGKDFYGAVVDTLNGDAFRDQSSTVSFNNDIPDTNSGSAMEGLTGSGDTINYYYNNMYGSGNTTQYSYGGSMNMRERGCGPVALADAYARRTGHGINAAALASAMSGSGNYDQNRGTTVGSYIRTAGSLGMGLTAGGVTTQSLRHASPNNPITVVGSGTGYGTRPGNIHYMNVVGADKNGMAYVSNPLLGGVRRMPTSAIANNSVLGLYGRGDAEDIMAKYHMPDGVSDAFNTLRTIASSFFSMFTGSDAESQMTAAEKSYSDANKLAQLKRDLGAAKYDEVYNAAYEKWKSENPKGATESDDTYNKRWEKAKTNAIVAYSKSAYEERATTAGYNANAIEDADKAANLSELFKQYDEADEQSTQQALQKQDSYMSAMMNMASGMSSGGSSGVGGYDVEDLIAAAAKVYSQLPASTTYGHYPTVPIQSATRGARKVRPDCSGIVSAIIQEMGYKLSSDTDDGIKAYQFMKPGAILNADGSKSSDWEWLDYSPSTLQRGDFTVGAKGIEGHISMPINNLTADFPKGFDGGKTEKIRASIKAAIAYMNGDENWESYLGSAMGYGTYNNAFGGAQKIIRFVGKPLEGGGAGTLGTDPSDQAVFSYIVNMLGMSKYGAAGMMGCMKYESGMKPNNLEDKFQSDWGYPAGLKGDQRYTADVTSGAESEEAFVGSHGTGKAGYGLVQFTSRDLKQDLYNRTVKNGYPIDDASAQLDIIANQMKKYKYKGSSVWDLVRGADSPTKANQQFLWHYEAGTKYTSDEAVARAYPWMGMEGINNRHAAAEQFYKLYGDKVQMMNGANLKGPAKDQFNKAAASYGGDGKFVGFIKNSGTTAHGNVEIGVNASGESLFYAIDVTNVPGAGIGVMANQPTYADKVEFTYGGRKYWAYGFLDTPSGSLARDSLIYNYGSSSGSSSSSSSSKSSSETKIITKFDDGSSSGNTSGGGHHRGSSDPWGTTTYTTAWNPPAGKSNTSEQAGLTSIYDSQGFSTTSTTVDIPSIDYYTDKYGMSSAYDSKGFSSSSTSTVASETKATYGGLFDNYLERYGDSWYYDGGVRRAGNEDDLRAAWNKLPGSGDTATFIPSLDSSAISDALFDSYGIKQPTTVNNVTVVRDDGSAKRAEMDAAIRATYNVRSESIEAILEEILSELKARRSSGTPTPKPTQSPESLFDNREIPVQIQRLTTG